METPQEQSQQQYAPQMYVNPYGGNHTQSIIQMTDTSREIEELKLSLECAEVVDNIKVHYGKPLLNSKGINSVIGQIKSIVHRITIMSNLDENEIRKLMLSLSDSLIIDLMINRRNYEVQGSYDRTKIVRMTQGVAYTCIKRAIYGDDKKLWGKVQHDMNTTIVQSGQQSQPWYKKWSPFK